MKVKVMATTMVEKGLDINLHLENHSRKKVSQILEVLNDALMGLLPKDTLKNVISPISDKTDVKRYNLKDVAKEEKLEIKNTIKYSNRDNFFVFLNEKDELVALINDYEIVKLYNARSDSNINTLLRDAHYVLNFKIEDIEENVKLPYARRVAREDSPAVERETHLNSQQAKLNSNYESFLNTIKKIKQDERKIIKNKQIQGNRRAIPITVSQLKKGDYFIQSKDDVTSPNNYIEVLSIKPRPNERNSYDLEYKMDRNDEIQRTDIAGDAKFFKVEFIDGDVEFDREYEVFVPKNIDWKSLIDSGQSFPNNLFSSDISYNLRKDLKEQWDRMVSIIRKDDLEVMKTRAIETYTDRVSKENYRGTSNLSYIDKSGYKVNLSKYFAKLLEVPPKVPAAVLAVYNENFKFIEEESKKIVELIKQHVADQNWSDVRKLSSLLSDYGTKQFNAEVEKYLKEESYDRKKEGSFSTKQAVSNIERFASYFKKEVENKE